MFALTLYHNPRCSKSRQALLLLEAQGIQPVLKLYLQDPPSASTLKHLLKLLGLPARALLRTSEQAYQDMQLDNPALSETALLQAMADEPRLIERPIAVAGNKAIIGRPPEKVLELLP